MSTTKTKAKPVAAEATPKKPTLWDIGADGRALNDLIEECGGDVTDPRVSEAFDAMFLEVAKDEANKLEGYAQMIRMLETEAAVAKAEAEQFTMKARHRTNQVARMKERVKEYLESLGRTEAHTAKGRTFKIQKAGGVAPLVIDENYSPDEIDPKFVKVVKSIDGGAVRSALEAGEPLAFARLGERGTYLALK
jgi:hypothetical protein